jgi:imidazolonepropionase-like amidohydrolase
MNRLSSIALPLLLSAFTSLAADSILFTGGVVHTAGDRGVITNGMVLVQSNKIAWVYDPAGVATRLPIPADAKVIKLNGEHIYPGLVAVDSALGLTEIDAVRATDDLSEVGDFTPDVESWVAVNPDSELLPVARANGIAYFEPVPQGKIVSGQSALMSMDGWTWEQMLVKKPAALHLFWPDMTLDTTPKERLADSSKWKSLEDQDKERRKNLATIQSFFDDARAYARARGSVHPVAMVPAWEAMLPALRGEVPVMVHAREERQIKSAVNWAVTNHLRMAICGGYDATRVAGLLATNHIPVVYEYEFAQPGRDIDPLDVHFTTPKVLRQAGVTVIFTTGASGFGAAQARNLPYHAAQAIAFGYPEEEALRSLTLYPAKMLGVADRLGSLAPGHDATLFICDGSIFDLRANVRRMWIAGREVSLASRHTRLYERYESRPK